MLRRLASTCAARGGEAAAAVGGRRTACSAAAAPKAGALGPASAEDRLVATQAVLVGAATQRVIEGLSEVRAFDATQPVPRGALVRALQAARCAARPRGDAAQRRAPSSAEDEGEPWRFYVLGEGTRAAMVDLLAEEHATACIERGDCEVPEHNAAEQWRTPVEMVAVSAKRVSLPPTAQPAGGEAAEGDAAQAQRARFDAATKGEEHMLAAAAAAQNIMLSLAGEQIGARWCLPRVARTKAFASLIGMPYATERCVGVIHVGFEADDGPLREQRPSRKHLQTDDAIARWLK